MQGQGQALSGCCLSPALADLEEVHASQPASKPACRAGMQGVIAQATMCAMTRVSGHQLLLAQLQVHLISWHHEAWAVAGRMCIAVRGFHEHVG